MILETLQRGKCGYSGVNKPCNDKVVSVACCNVHKLVHWEMWNALRNPEVAQPC